DQVPDEAKSKRKSAEATRAAAPAPAQDAEDTEADAEAPQPAPARSAASTHQPPRDPAEAEQRFFARYSEVIGGDNWAAVQRFLQSRAPRPTTVEGWIAAAEAVRDRARQDSASVMSA